MKLSKLILALVPATSLLLFPSLSQGETEEGDDIHIPIAIGQGVKGVRFPQYDKHRGGKLNMRFNAEKAERASEKTFNFKGLHIEVFDKSTEKMSMEVFLKEAVFDRNTSLLTSEEESTITGEQFKIIGRSMEFDSKTRNSRLRGPVIMTITELEEQAGS